MLWNWRGGRRGLKPCRRYTARDWLSIWTIHSSRTLYNHPVNEDDSSVSLTRTRRFREVTGQGQPARKWHSRD